MADSLDQQKAKLEALRKEYEQLTKKRAPIFDESNIENVTKGIDAMNLALEEAKDRASSLSEGFAGIDAQIKSIVSELKKGNDATSLATKGYKGIQGITEKLKYDQAGITELGLKQLENEKSKFQQLSNEVKEQSKKLAQEKGIVDLSKTNLKFRKDLTKEEYAILLAAQEEFQVFKDIDDALNTRIQKEKDINKLMGVGGAALAGISTALGKMGFSGLANRLGLDEAQKKMREVAKEIQEGGGNVDSIDNKFKVLKSGLGQIDLKGALLDPLTITVTLVTKFIEAFTMLDKMTGDTAKNLNISAEESQALNKELNQIAASSNDVALNTKGLNESLNAVGKSLGTNAALNQQDLETFTKLREQAGFTNDELVGIQKLSLATNTSLEDNTAEFLGQAKALATQNGLVLNEKQLLKEVSNTSSAITVSMGMSLKNLAEAQVAAKALGTNLEQVDKIAEGLLQFESSISAELEAELLTGKQINLEKARSAALNNDLATVAEEITKQVGSAAEFGKMNRIQQEAFARAVGMSREELSKTLVEQEALRKIGASSIEDAREEYDQLVATYGVEEARKRLGDEELAKQFEQQSLQERFNQSIIKLQELFVGLAEPVMSILSPLMEIVETVLPAINFILSPIIEGFSVLGGLIKSFFNGIKEGNPLLITMAGILAAMALPAIIGAIGAIYTSLSAIPFVGPALATAAVVGMFSMMTKAKSEAKVPKAQFGAEVTGGGSVMVGEVGPEIINLPTGAKVNPLPVRERRDLQPQQTTVQSDNKEMLQALNNMNQRMMEQQKSMGNMRVVMSTNALEAGMVQNTAKIQ